MERLQKNKTYTVTVDGYASDGLGVARIDGQVVFIHRAIAGETCRIQILKVLKNVAYARILDWEVRSVHRIEPDCPYYGRCGGCDFRHMDYEAELAAKRQRVQDAITRIGKADVEVEEIFGSALQKGYRNKGQYPVSADGTVGFYRARTHEVVEVKHCLLQQSCADGAAEAVREWMAKYAVRGYDDSTGEGLVRHIYTRVSTMEKCLVCVIINGNRAPHENELVEAVRRHCPGVSGILLGINTKKGNVILGDRYRLLWGEERLDDTLCGMDFRLSVPSFYQVNHAQTEVLYDKAVTFAGLSGAETVLDLYCGVGTISLALAKHARKVIGAEIVPEAIADAKENAARNGVENVDFRCGDAGEIAQQLAEEGVKPDVVVIDPPRKGLFPDVIETIAQMASARVVYVSCDPGTLGRDLFRFAAHGYKAVRALAVDMFPRTCHVESVVLITRKEK